MKTSILTVIVFASSFSLMSCESTESELVASELLSEELVITDVAAVTSAEVATVAEVCSVTTTILLTESDKAGLLQMREEEKMAGDVYTYFYNLYKYPVFLNISKSEAVHSNAVLNLIKAYGLQDPASTVPGVFNDTTIQSIYNSLTAKGATITDALAVGAFIEEYDIKDLQNEIAASTNADIRRVYTNLLRASGFHLKSFTRLLKFKGVVYTPQILTQAEYDAIVK